MLSGNAQLHVVVFLSNNNAKIYFVFVSDLKILYYLRDVKLVRLQCVNIGCYSRIPLQVYY